MSFGPRSFKVNLKVFRADAAPSASPSPLSVFTTFNQSFRAITRCPVNSNGKLCAGVRVCKS